MTSQQLQRMYDFISKVLRLPVEPPHELTLPQRAAPAQDARSESSNDATREPPERAA